MARTHHTQRHKGIRRAGSSLWLELNATGRGATNRLDNLACSEEDLSRKE